MRIAVIPEDPNIPTVREIGLTDIRIREMTPGMRHAEATEKEDNQEDTMKEYREKSFDSEEDFYKYYMDGDADFDDYEDDDEYDDEDFDFEDEDEEDFDYDSDEFDFDDKY